MLKLAGSETGAPMAPAFAPFSFDFRAQKRDAISKTCFGRMTKKYNVGIIGYGWVSEAHIAALNATSLAQVTAVCSSRPLDAKALTEKHHSPIECFTDLDAMLAKPDLHVVSICSYPQEHSKQAVKEAHA